MISKSCNNNIWANLHMYNIGENICFMGHTFCHENTFLYQSAIII